MKLTTNNLTKEFKEKIAVDDVALNITSGVWGLLGANGAGKTTLMRMLCGIITPTQGNVCLDGLEINALGQTYRKLLGYLPQNFGFHPDFTVRDYLFYISSLKGLNATYAKQQIDLLLETLSLTDVFKKQIKKLSGGMQRRVGIAQAMINEPQILILDEPTSGLDPGERVRFRKYISEFSEGKIVILSTHIVSDIEAISTSNLIMKHGKIALTGSTESLTAQLSSSVWESKIAAHRLAETEKVANIVNIQPCENEQLLIRYIAAKPVVKSSVLTTPRLEDVYMNMTGGVNANDDT